MLLFSELQVNLIKIRARGGLERIIQPHKGGAGAPAPQMLPFRSTGSREDDYPAALFHIQPLMMLLNSIHYGSGEILKL